VLSVGEATLARYGAVSEQTACEMAVGARTLVGADIAVSVTGIAGPGGGTAEKPVGLVYIGVSTENGVYAVKNLFDGTREQVRLQTCIRALELAAEELNS
ncbi:MAG: CinA family protein, partial [Clostridia bacterium]|nr:CinA family protein [Clostridia bacterium]